jgi:hypothetical protein
MFGMLTKPRAAILFFRELMRKVDRLQVAVGRLEARSLAQNPAADLRGNEFTVYSQWGEDGIIQRLIREVPIRRRIFVEFGVENYRESNTRFLLVHDNWSGLVIDGSEANVRTIRSDEIYWRYNLKAENAFITRENINELISRNGIEGEIGLLSVDIDGNDYWVWEAITTVSPAIVIAEYNHRFGKDRAVTTPYRPDFVRTQAHHSTVYYGASLRALYLLGKNKGYVFVGCNSSGNNAFFVRRDLMPSRIKECTVEEAFVAAQFREARDSHGQLEFRSPSEEHRLIESLPVVDVQ